MKTTTSKRIRRGVSIALTSMLLAAPAAQARLDEGAGVARPSEQPSVRIVDGGFSWAAAGIGAGAALAALAVAGGAGHVARRRSLPAHS